MRIPVLYAAAALLTFSATAHATVYSFVTDPFEGSDALTTPGRQFVGGGGDLINFNIATDIFAFDPAVFGVANQVLFANAEVGNLPTGGVNIIVLQTTDNDSNPITPFAVATAADWIAEQITTSGPGFFIQFNSVIDIPILAYSTDLNDNTADVAVLARITSFSNPELLGFFSADDFAMIEAAAIPEPSGLLVIMGVGAAWAANSYARRRRRALTAIAD